MVKKIIQAGDRRLKAKNRLIKNFKSPEFKKLVRNLIDSMHKADLIGIAAPQIGENYMVFITHPRTTKARKLGKTDKVRVYIDPKITFQSKDKSLIYEGCGSIGDLFGPVLRPREVQVEAYDERGLLFRLKADGILARIIFHEMDHLNGVEFMEKVSDYSKIITKKHYRKNIRNSPQQLKNSKTTKIEATFL